MSGRDVEFVVYGWSRAPIFDSGTSVWPLPDAVFQRLVESREPFWTTVERDGETFRVYFLSDRGGIYALGYPVITLGRATCQPRRADLAGRRALRRAAGRR